MANIRDQDLGLRIRVFWVFSGSSGEGNEVLLILRLGEE